MTRTVRLCLCVNTFLPLLSEQLPSPEAVASRRRLRSQDRKLLETANAACAGVVDYDLCVEDVVATGEVELADNFH